jgi:hypothetical protein
MQAFASIWIQIGAEEECNVVFEWNASEGADIDARFNVTISIREIAYRQLFRVGLVVDVPM